MNATNDDTHDKRCNVLLSHLADDRNLTNRVCSGRSQLVLERPVTVATVRPVTAITAITAVRLQSNPVTVVIQQQLVTAVAAILPVPHRLHGCVTAVCPVRPVTAITAIGAQGKSIPALRPAFSLSRV